MALALHWSTGALPVDAVQRALSKNSPRRTQMQPVPSAETQRQTNRTTMASRNLIRPPPAPTLLKPPTHRSRPTATPSHSPS